MDQRDVLQKLFDESQKALLVQEDGIASNLFQTYQKRINEIIDDLMAINQSLLNSDNPSLGQWRALKLDSRSLQVLVNKMTGLDCEVAQQLKDDLAQYSTEAYNRQVWMLDQTTPPNVETIWNPPADQALKDFMDVPWQGERFSDRLWAINNTMAEKLQQTLRDGILAGDSMDDIARDMRADVGIPLSAKLITRPQASAQVYRAMLIARTEAMRLTNDMQKRAWGENQNFMTERVWRTAPGFLGVCDDCAELDGVSSEDLDGEEPPLHPNCRCMMTMVPKPFQELYGGAFDEPIDQYEMKVASPTTGNPVAVSVQPYDEWMNS